MVVERIEDLRQAEGCSYRTLCEQEGIAYSSLMRWKDRVARGVSIIGMPGPKKVASLDLDALRAEIRLLRHGRKRSEGTGDLYRRQRDQVSRRQFSQLVSEERLRKNRERNRVYHEVIWKTSRLVWALDDSEYQPDPLYPKAYLHNIQDLGSRYKFEPVVGLELAHGPKVASNLNDLFEVHGPPLFIKRDNGGNLNHTLVEAVLESFMVIPINSPCYYPQYNGGIERAQYEIKEQLSRMPSLPPAFLSIQAELDVQSLNHRPRSCLGYRSSCQVFTAGRETARVFNRRKRREVYEWIKQKTVELMNGECYDCNAAWRLAVETWLLENNFIEIRK